MRGEASCLREELRAAQREKGRLVAKKAVATDARTLRDEARVEDERREYFELLAIEERTRRKAIINRCHSTVSAAANAARLILEHPGRSSDRVACAIRNLNALEGELRMNDIFSPFSDTTQPENLQIGVDNRDWRRWSAIKKGIEAMLTPLAPAPRHPKDTPDELAEACATRSGVRAALDELEALDKATVQSNQLVPIASSRTRHARRIAIANIALAYKSKIDTIYPCSVLDALGVRSIDTRLMPNETLTVISQFQPTPNFGHCKHNHALSSPKEDLFNTDAVGLESALQTKRAIESSVIEDHPSTRHNDTHTLGALHRDDIQRQCDTTNKVCTEAKLLLGYSRGDESVAGEAVSSGSYSQRISNDNDRSLTDTKCIPIKKRVGPDTIGGLIVKRKRPQQELVVRLRKKLASAATQLRDDSRNLSKLALRSKQADACAAAACAELATMRIAQEAAVACVIAIKAELIQAKRTTGITLLQRIFTFKLGAACMRAWRMWSKLAIRDKLHYVARAAALAAIARISVYRLRTTAVRGALKQWQDATLRHALIPKTADDPASSSMVAPQLRFGNSQQRISGEDVSNLSDSGTNSGSSICSSAPPPPPFGCNRAYQALPDRIRGNTKSSSSRAEQVGSTHSSSFTQQAGGQSSVPRPRQGFKATGMSTSPGRRESGAGESCTRRSSVSFQDKATTVSPRQNVHLIGTSTIASMQEIRNISEPMPHLQCNEWSGNPHLRETGNSADAETGTYDGDGGGNECIRLLTSHIEGLEAELSRLDPSLETHELGRRVRRVASLLDAQECRKNDVSVLVAQNDALVTALRATPRDATVASAQIRVLEARLESLADQIERERAAHRADLARHELALKEAHAQFASERANFVTRLQDEAATIHDLTDRCDELQSRLEQPAHQKPRVAAAFLSSRDAAETIDYYARRRHQKSNMTRRTPVVTPTQPGFAPRRRHRSQQSRKPPAIAASQSSTTTLSVDESGSAMRVDPESDNLSGFIDSRECAALSQLLDSNATVLRELRSEQPQVSDY